MMFIHLILYLTPCHRYRLTTTTLNRTRLHGPSAAPIRHRTSHLHVRPDSPLKEFYCPLGPAGGRFDHPSIFSTHVVSDLHHHVRTLSLPSSIDIPSDDRDHLIYNQQ